MDDDGVSVRLEAGVQGGVWGGGEGDDMVGDIGDFGHCELSMPSRWTLKAN